MKQEVAVVWLKRDLRLNDHGPLFHAKKSRLPLIVLYCFEPTLSSSPDWDVRHWRFIYQSILDLQKKIPVTWTFTEVLQTLDHISEHFQIKTLYSHQESGTKITYERDKAVSRWCKRNACSWKQYQSSGVVRNLKDHKSWERLWASMMKRSLLDVDVTDLSFACTNNLILNHELSEEIKNDDPRFQMGGESRALMALESFIGTFDFSKKTYIPSQGHYTSSTLSPYISWGNISLRQVYQEALKIVSKGEDQKNILQFINRLKWHCFFIQKFELDLDLEFPRDGRKLDKELFRAWRQGQTGYPIVDAAMRCVKESGHINYRLRSLVVSFLTYHLGQPWEEGAKYLARQFLDYNPGIHYPQFHLQSKAIHNPIKQSRDKDEDAEFIRRWIPELKETPTHLIHRPWQITGSDYPYPIIKLWKSLS